MSIVMYTDDKAHKLWFKDYRQSENKHEPLFLLGLYYCRYMQWLCVKIAGAPIRRSFNQLHSPVVFIR